MSHRAEGLNDIFENHVTVRGKAQVSEVSVVGKAQMKTAKVDDNLGVGTSNPANAIHAAESFPSDGKIRADVGFNVDGTDGIEEQPFVIDAFGFAHDFEFVGGLLTSYNQA